MTSAAALEAGDGRQLRFDAVDALDVVDIGRVDGSVEHLEANLTRRELAGGKLSEPDDFIGLAEGGEGCRGGGRHGDGGIKSLIDQKLEFHGTTSDE